jgi:hypothetical protein
MALRQQLATPHSIVRMYLSFPGVTRIGLRQ